MPGPAIGIRCRVGRVGECSVDTLAVADVGRAVDRRPDERMTEGDPIAELQEPIVFRGRGVVESDPEFACRSPQQCRVAERLGRGEDQEQPRRVRQARVAAKEAVLDAPRQRNGGGQTEAAGEVAQ